MIQPIDVQFANSNEQLEAKSKQAVDSILGISTAFEQVGDVLQEQIAVICSLTDEIKGLANVSVDTGDKVKGSVVTMISDFKSGLLNGINFEKLENQSTSSLSNIADHIKKLKADFGGSMGGADLDFLNKSLEDLEKEMNLRNPFLGFINGMNEFKAAQEEFPALMEQLIAAQTEYEASKESLDSLDGQVKEGKLSTDSEKYTKALQRMTLAQKALGTSTLNVNKNLNSQQGALKTISTSVKNAGATLSTLGKNAANMAKIFGDDLSGRLNQCVTLLDSMVSGTISIIDAFDKVTRKSVDGIGNVVDSTANGIKAASTTSVTAIKLVESASVILAIISAAVQVLTAIFAMFGGPAQMAKSSIDFYEDFIAVTDRLIAKQKTLLKVLSGVGLAMVAQQGKELFQKQIQATREIGIEYLKSGKGWGSRSQRYRANENINKFRGDFRLENEDDKKLFEGVNLNTMNIDQMFNMTGEQLQRLMEMSPKFWAKLDDDTRSYLETIIDTDEKMKQFEESVKAAALQMTFDEVSEGLKTLLLNVDATAEDVSNSFETMMQKAVVKLVQNGSYIARLKEWYDKVAAIFTAKDMSKEEKAKAIAEAREEYMDIYSDAKTERDAFAKEFGIDFSPTPEENGQEAQKGGFETMSQETGSELLGQFTAIRIHTSDIYRIMSEMENDEKIVTNHLANIDRNTQITVSELQAVNEKLKQITIEGVKAL